LKALKSEGLVFSRLGDGTYASGKTRGPGEAMRKTATFIMPQYPSSTYKAIVESFIEAAPLAGFSLELRYASWDEPLSESLKGIDADAIIVHPGKTPVEAEELALLKRSGKPSVVVGCHLPMLDVDTVATDDALGGMLAAEHLISLGHRSLAVMLAEPSQSATSSIRVDAFLKRCALAGLPEPAILDCGTKYGQNALDNAYVKAKQVAVKRLGFSALFITSDHSALGAMKAFHESGVGIPSDLSLIAFDDIPESAYYFPPLSTVRQDFKAWAKESFAILSERLDGKGEAGESHVCLAPSLVARSSTGAPPLASGGAQAVSL